MDAFVVEKVLHHAVSWPSAGFMVYLLDLLKDGSFCLLLGVLAVLPVVVVSIRVYSHVLQQPVCAKALRILIDELVPCYLISFA